MIGKIPQKIEDINYIYLLTTQFILHHLKRVQTRPNSEQQICNLGTPHTGSV